MKIQLEKQRNDFHFQLQCQIPDQGITAIFGRSGAGKTSLINMIAGIEQPDKGRIEIHNQLFLDSAKNINIPVHQRQIAYVFQQSRLFPHYRVLGNLKYGYNKQADPKSELFQQVVNLLDIEHLLKRYPVDLSGGEAQRVAIGRALLSRPSLLIMDEPLASLDIPRKRELLHYLTRLNKSLKLPILYVTHSLDEVLSLADHILLLENGKLVQQGDVETVWNSDKMQPWLGKAEHSAILHTKIKQQHPQYNLTGLELDENTLLWAPRIDLADGSDIRLRIFAKDVSLTKHASTAKESSIRNIFAVSVVDMLSHGEGIQIKLSLGSNLLWADITQWAMDDLAITKGQILYAQVKGVSVNQNDWANLESETA